MDLPKPNTPLTPDTPDAPADATAARESQAAQRASARLPQPRLRAVRGEPVHEGLWEAVGGSATFERIVREFYTRVRRDDLLAPMYPQEDWEGAIERLTLFLEQYWGGPRTYSERRGHPRLRMRHAAFPITPDARDRWLTHMHAALDAVALPMAHDSAIREYIDRAAHSLVNTFARPDSPSQHPTERGSSSPR